MDLGPGNLAKENLQALLHDPGWLMVCGLLENRKQEALRRLVTLSDMEAVRREQIRVQEIEGLLNAPRRLLQDINNQEENV